MENNNYYQVSGWMRNELNLSGNELSTFAIIYGFTQAQDQWYTGSLRYLQDWLGVSKPTAMKALEGLTEKGLIEKHSDTRSNVTLNKYRVNLVAVKNLYRGSNIFTGGGKVSLLGGGKDSLPNNTSIDNTSIDNTKDNKEINCEKAVSLNLFGAEIAETEKKKMMFKNSLVSKFEIFDKKFVAEEYKNVDINYYFYAVADWSLQKSTKVLRTNEGWIATARTWIRNDFKAGKLKIKSNSSEQEQYLEYLKDSNASN